MRRRGCPLIWPRAIGEREGIGCTFRIAEGSVAEVRAHLQVALAWGWIEARDVEQTMSLLDRELGLICGLTH